MEEWVFCWIGIQYTMPYSPKCTPPHCFFCNWVLGSLSRRRRQIFFISLENWKEIVILPPSQKQTNHIRSNDEEIRKLANHIKSFKRQQQTINIIAIVGSAFVFFFNSVLYIVLSWKRYVNTLSREKYGKVGFKVIFFKCSLQWTLSNSTSQGTKKKVRNRERKIA